MTVETTKLTFRLPKQHVDFAKRYAQGHGMSVNDLIDSYIRRLQSPPGGAPAPSWTRSPGCCPAMPTLNQSTGSMFCAGRDRDGPSYLDSMNRKISGRQPPGLRRLGLRQGTEIDLIGRPAFKRRMRLAGHGAATTEMRNTLNYRGYTASIELDTDDNVLVGRVLDIDDIITFHAESVADFTRAFHASVDDYLTACEQLAQAPDKPASGRLCCAWRPRCTRRR